MGFIELKIENKIGFLTINKPETLNALDNEMLILLKDKITCVEENKDISVLVITGTGKSFVAGADISLMKDFTPEMAEDYGYLGAKVFKKIEELKIPVIAAINGFALGGGLELALSADIRLSNMSALVGFPEVSLSIIPGFGGTQRMSRLVGISKTKELIYTCKKLKALEAKEMGIINQVFENDVFMEEVTNFAKKIASYNIVSLKQSKACINASVFTDEKVGYDFESKAFGLCFADDSPKKSMEAFLNKGK